MRVLILGVSGLIGHKMFQELSGSFEVIGALHRIKKSYGDIPLFKPQNILEGIDVSNFKKIEKLLSLINPDVVLNCVGITRRKINENNLLDTININALFPHRLAKWAGENNKRVIHFSTDCVFDGKQGNYTEESLTTPEDTYGKTKALGEIDYNHTLTIRSSFIGRELFSKTELLEWFLNNNNVKVDGYTNAMYTGVSTIFLAKSVVDIINNYPNLSGIRQLATDHPISKFELLCLAKEAFAMKTQIIPNDNVLINPTLNGSKLKNEINYIVPSWEEMMNELASDQFTYKT